MRKTILCLAACSAVLAGCGAGGGGVVAPAVEVVSLNGSESWIGGETHEIAWTFGGPAPRVDIAYTTDGGTNWVFIATDESNTGAYSWTVPAGVSSTQCRIWVQTTDGRAKDTSDDVFEILPFSASPAVEWSAAAQTVDEDAGTVTVSATLSAFGASDVIVPFTVSGTASGAADHDLTDGSITIASGEMTGSATFAVVDDGINEDDETITLTMGAPTAADLGTVTVHTVTVADNDGPPTVEWSADSQAAGEAAGTVTVTAELSGLTSADVTVPFTVSGTALEPDDHDLVDGSVVIAAGTLGSSVTFAVVDDGIDESAQTVILTMGVPTNAVQGATTVHTVTIVDDDAPPTLEWTLGAQTVDEAVGMVVLTATLSSASSLNVWVWYTVGGNAANPGDHDAADGMLFIPAGSTSALLPINVVDDGTSEMDETVVVTLDSPSNATLGANAAHTMTITDNDVPMTEWDAAAQTAGEGVGGVTVTASLSGLTGSDVTVDFVVSGTASNPEDHDLSGGSILIPAGSASGSVAFNVLDDALAEGDEAVVLTMNAVTNAVLGATTVHTVTIWDDEGPTVEWTAAAQPMGENAGAVTVTATLPATTGLDVTVVYTVGGTAIGPGDHDLVDGSVVIPAGNLAGSVTFNVQDDALDEDDETVILTMEVAANASLGTVTVHTVTITDDDLSPTVEWTVASQSTPESPVTVLVTAVLSAVSGREVTASFTVAGTATNPDDHDLADGIVVIAAGELTGPTGFGVFEDALDEDDETVVITMQSATGAGLGAVTVHTVTIADDDPMPRIEWVGASQTVGEDAGTVTVTATLSAPSARDVAAPYSVGGSALNPDDHDLANGALTIAAGGTSDTVTFSVIGDSDAEPNETVTLTIGAPTNANLGAASVHTVTIADDDSDWDVTVTAVTESSEQNNACAAGERVSVMGPDMNEPGNDTMGFGAGFLMPMMQPPQPGTFHAPGDVDWFWLNIMMPGTHTVETSDLRFGADTVIELYREGEETPVMVDDDGGSEPGASKLTFVIDFMDQFYVRVTHASGGTGHYMIEFREGL